MHIFPTGLDNSLFPAIFIGVLFAFLAVETLGWSFTGLVVPGYLASVSLVAPHAAGLMLVEALVTLALVRLLGDGAALARVGSRFFGRERFFMTLALATGVRLVLDRLGLALSGAEAPAHSIGLVLVPLIAHTLDRAGLRRGLVQILTLTAVTSVIVLLLVLSTNLTLADLSLTFEDVAFRIDQSPRGYVVLLCGALLAARANVAFGWDFHGIIVPGLLAVAWFTPAKVGLTLIEALAVLLLAHALLRLPWLRRLQVEGPRRLMLLFVADAIIKFTVVFAARATHPSDLYGFGYLLPTLLAAKMWQRGSVGRVLLPAAQVSIGGFILGNGVIFGFGRLAIWLAPAAAMTLASGAPATTLDRAAALARAGVAEGGELTQLSAEEANLWRAAWRRFAGGASPAQAFARIARAGLDMAPLSDDAGGVAVREAARDGGAPPRGLGTAVLRAQGRPVVVALPRPLDGDLTLAAPDVVRALDARALIVAGRPTPMGGMLTTPYAIAAEETARDAWVVLAVDERAPPGGIVRVGPSTWPEAVSLAGVRAIFPDVRVEWTGGGGDVILAAPAGAWSEVASRPCAAAANERALAPAAALTPSAIERDGPTREDFDPAERLLYAEGVIAPLVRAARASRSPGATCRAASALGLRVGTVRDADGTRYFAVDSDVRAGTAVLVRAGEADEVVFASPGGGDLTTRRATVALFVASAGRAAILGAPAAHSGRSSYDAALEALADVSAGRGVALEVRAGGRYAVLAWGGVAGTPDSAPAWLAGLLRGMARVGLPALDYDGAEALAPWSGMDSSRRATLARRGMRLAALYLPADLRARRFGPDGIQAALAHAEDLGIPRVAIRLDAVFRTHGRGLSCADLAATYRHARRFAELRHVADLRAAARPGVRLAVDPVTGESGLVGASPCGAFAVNLRTLDILPAQALALPDEMPPTPELLLRLRHGGLSGLYHGDLTSLAREAREHELDQEAR